MDSREFEAQTLHGFDAIVGRDLQQFGALHRGLVLPFCDAVRSPAAMKVSRGLVGAHLCCWVGASYCHLLDFLEGSGGSCLGVRVGPSRKAARSFYRSLHPELPIIWLTAKRQNVLIGHACNPFRPRAQLQPEVEPQLEHL